MLVGTPGGWGVGVAVGKEVLVGGGVGPTCTGVAVGTGIGVGNGIAVGTGVGVGISQANGVLVGSGVGVGGIMLTVTYRSATIFTLAKTPFTFSTPPHVITNPGRDPATKTISVPPLYAPSDLGA